MERVHPEAAAWGGAASSTGVQHHDVRPGGVDGDCVVMQVIHKHFYLKRTEIMCQCEEWISDIQQYSSDKRVGRTMSHHAAALKVAPPPAS